MRLKLNNNTENIVYSKPDGYKNINSSCIHNKSFIY